MNGPTHNIIMKANDDAPITVLYQSDRYKNEINDTSIKSTINDDIKIVINKYMYHTQ